MTVLPRFVLGHNALIGVHHSDKSKDVLKDSITEKETNLIDQVIDLGIEAIVLDNHPVAIGVAIYLEEKAPNVSVIPMVPYALSVVDEASRSGLSGVVREMLGSSISMGSGGIFRTIASLLSWNLTQAGSHVALWNYVRPFPSRKPKICFLHNVVTDLMLGWSSEGIVSFANSCRSRGITPGFVTLNPGEIPWMVDKIGTDAWFMTSVNSAGVQMSPSREIVEDEVLSRDEINILAMSVLGGGILDPKEEIPRSLSFPAVKSLVIGSGNIGHIRELQKVIQSC